MRALPSLNGVKAFEAAARRGGFAGAAEELNVTPAAISQQIKQLEDQLGCELFRRSNRNLVLTDEGQACLPGLAEAFERIVQALEQIDAAGQAGPLTVSVAPSFAAKWLMPRLSKFQQLHPAIDVRVIPTDEELVIARATRRLALAEGVTP